MGQQIIRQPNGQFAIFSTITDTIILWDATGEEVEDFFVEQAAGDTRRRVHAALEHVAAGQPEKAYFQFAVTWDGALNMDRRHGGDAWREFRGSEG